MATKTKRVKRKQIKIKPSLMIGAIAAAVIIAVIIACVSLADEHPALTIPFTKEVSQGVDVSEHNGKIDWQALSEEFDFAFIRVGYRGYSEKGSIFEDKNARKNLAAAEKTGMPIGIYFYSQATTEAEAKKEADFALSFARKYNISLPIMIDFEYPQDKNGKEIGRLSESKLTPSESAEVINAFLDRVESKGYVGGVYASSYVYASRIESKSLNSNAVIWVADYNKIVTYNVDYTIWQYSERGKSDAVSSKYIDLNYWYK